MRKNKLLLLLVLLMTVATGAWATDYTTLAVGDVIKVGDTFSPTADGAFNDFGVATGKTYTLIRADIDNEYNVTEKTDGAFYVFKYVSMMNPYIHFEKAFAVTAISDGLEVTKIEDVKGMLMYTLALHESAPTTYSVTLAEVTEDGDNWTISPTEAAEGATVTATYNGEKRVKSVKAVKKGGAPDPLAVPMTIEALTPGIISVSNPKEGMQYSKNGGAKTAMAEAPTEINVAVGDKVQFYGNGTSITSYQGTIITGSGDGFTCKVYGNIMSLVDEEGFATATTLSVYNTFYRLFYENTTLTDASGLLLPATELAPDCYDQMFMNCTHLTTAPVLPATKLVEKCYYRMFYNCTALTAAPELPATKLAAECYNQMFRLCISLTTVPSELPATELANSCYRSMFMGCTALTTAPVLPATTLAEYCYYQMFTNCTSLTAAPALPATELPANCYYQMFSSCTSLTTAPVLAAPTLVQRCYFQMFYGCSKLATVTCLATSGINEGNSTTRWLQSAGTEVEGAKTVYTVGTANWPEPNNNGIPIGWTRADVDN